MKRIGNLFLILLVFIPLYLFSAKLFNAQASSSCQGEWKCEYFTENPIVCINDGSYRNAGEYNSYKTQADCETANPCGSPGDRCMLGGCHWSDANPPPSGCTQDSQCGDPSTMMCCIESGTCQSNETPCGGSSWSVSAATGLSHSRTAFIPGFDTVNLTWTPSSDANDYQVFMLDTNQNKVDAKCDDPTDPCIFDVKLPVDTSSYLVYLPTGTNYWWQIVSYKKQTGNHCHAGSIDDNFMYCDLSPNPMYLGVGQTQTITSSAQSVWTSGGAQLYVRFSVNNGTISLPADTKITSYPYQIGVYGVSNNTDVNTTVTGKVYIGPHSSDDANHPWCSTDATVNVWPVLPPSGLTASCTTTPTNTSSTATVGWASDPGASYYSLRVDDRSNSWQPGACPDTPAPPDTANTGIGGDQCLNLAGTSHSFPGTPSHTYGWWLHARDSVGNWIPINGVLGPGTFSCPINSVCSAIHYNCIWGTSATQTEGASAYTWDCNGLYGGTIAHCSQSKLATGPWWQVKNGDVTTNGDLESVVPAGNYLDLAGSGGYPGIPMYKGSSSTLNEANVSEKGWLVNSANSTRVYDSSYFLNPTPSGTLINHFSNSDIDSSTLTSGQIDPATGYYWYAYDGTNDLTINGNIDFGTDKVVLLVKKANVTIKGKINLTDGQGFFLLAVGGNIVVDPSVTSLEGIFVADDQFITGTNSPAADSELQVRGSVAAYDEGNTGKGFNLQRDTRVHFLKGLTTFIPS